MDYIVSFIRQSDNEEVGKMTCHRLPTVGGIIDAPNGEIWEVLHVAPDGTGAYSYWAVVQPFRF